MYEVEIKVLLGTVERANQLLKEVQKIHADFEVVGQFNQINHYFVGGELKALADKMALLLPSEELAKLQEIALQSRSYSLRSREIDNKEVRLVVKASVDDGSSSNGVSRREWEAVLPIKLTELDNLILDCGYQYQAKWSRQRQEFKFAGVTLCLDQNAGYGFVAEFEKVVLEASETAAAASELRTFIAKLGLQELDQNRLDRMFQYYNQNWPEYYGTDKIFVVE
jgi:adenylate cyclase class IV